MTEETSQVSCITFLGLDFHEFLPSSAYPEVTRPPPRFLAGLILFSTWYLKDLERKTFQNPLRERRTKSYTILLGPKKCYRFISKRVIVLPCLEMRQEYRVLLMLRPHTSPLMCVCVA